MSKTERPWGWYDVIDQGDRYKVKNIMVKPGQRLSLQKHHHRTEHWIVVSGTAEVQLNNDRLLPGSTCIDFTLYEVPLSITSYQPQGLSSFIF